MRKQVAVIALTLGLFAPALAQETHPAAMPPAQQTMTPGEKSFHQDAQKVEQDLNDEGNSDDMEMAETQEKTLQFLRTNEPEMYAEMDKIRTSDPDQYQRMVTMESHHVRSFEDLQETDPEGFRLQIAELRAHDRVGLVARNYQVENSHGNKADLKAAVDQLFAARQAVERHDIEMARKDVSEWATELQAREAKRTSIVDHYVQEISYPDSERW